MAAQSLLRHKSRKMSFRIVLWITAVLNLAALGWLMASPAIAVLKALDQRLWALILAWKF
jgi:hypothetical protein